MNKPTVEESTFTIDELISTLRGLNLPGNTKVLVYDDIIKRVGVQGTRPVTRIDSNDRWVILD